MINNSGPKVFMKVSLEEQYGRKEELELVLRLFLHSKPTVFAPIACWSGMTLMLTKISASS